ncbi:MAG: hypothetical protein ACE5JF_12780, partial [Anaerolineales bacterium]
YFLKAQTAGADADFAHEFLTANLALGKHVQRGLRSDCRSADRKGMILRSIWMAWDPEAGRL